MSEILQQAIQAIKTDDKANGKKLLLQVIQQDSNNELAWLWMTKVVNTNAQRRQCLEYVLKINPDNEAAKKGLAILNKRQEQEFSSQQKSKVDTIPKKISLSQIWLGVGLLVLVFCSGWGVLRYYLALQVNDQQIVEKYFGHLNPEYIKRPMLDVNCRGFNFCYRMINILPTTGEIISLSIQNNNDLTTLPPEIGQLSNLEELLLFNDRLTTLPPEIGQLSNLRRFNVESNDLTTLPPEIGQLSNLEMFAVYGNELTTLPPEIGQLSNLQTLSLGNNKLTTLPPEMGQLSNLQFLLLEDNPITYLPPEIEQLPNLEIRW